MRFRICWGSKALGWKRWGIESRGGSSHWFVGFTRWPKAVRHD